MLIRGIISLYLGSYFIKYNAKVLLYFTKEYAIETSMTTYMFVVGLSRIASMKNQ